MGAMFLPQDIALLILDFLATVTTLVRLGHRYRRQQLWWDDFWALFACLIAWLAMIVAGIGLFTDYSTPIPPFSIRTASFLTWANFFTQSSAVWASRLSIQATVIRFLPPGRNKSISRYAFAALAIMWITASVSKAFYCGVPIPVLPLCWYSKVPTSISLSLSVAGTTWLVAWPAYIVTRMKLASSHRRLFILCFSFTGLLAVVDILHEISIIMYAYWIVRVTAHVEMLLAIVVSNVLTLATYIYRLYRASNGATDSEEITSTDVSTSKRGITAASMSERSRNPDSRALSEGTSIIGPLTTIYTDDIMYDSPSGASVSQGSSEKRVVGTIGSSNYEVGSRSWRRTELSSASGGGDIISTINSV